MSYTQYAMQIKMIYMLVYWNMYYISMFIYYPMLYKPEWPDFSPQLLPILLCQETSTNNTSELEKGREVSLVFLTHVWEVKFREVTPFTQSHTAS